MPTWRESTPFGKRTDDTSGMIGRVFGISSSIHSEAVTFGGLRLIVAIWSARCELNFRAHLHRHANCRKNEDRLSNHFCDYCKLDERYGYGADRRGSDDQAGRSA